MYATATARFRDGCPRLLSADSSHHRHDELPGNAVSCSSSMSTTSLGTIRNDAEIRTTSRPSCRRSARPECCRQAVRCAIDGGRTAGGREHPPILTDMLPNLGAGIDLRAGRRGTQCPLGPAGTLPWTPTTTPSGTLMRCVLSPADDLNGFALADRKRTSPTSESGEDGESGAHFVIPLGGFAIRRG